MINTLFNTLFKLLTWLLYKVSTYIIYSIYIVILLEHCCFEVFEVSNFHKYRNQKIK